MNEIRGIGVLTLTLVWLAVGVGCADSDTKPSKVGSPETPEENLETVLTDQPLADEPRSTIIPLNKIWGHMIPKTQSMHLLEQDIFEPVVRKNIEQEKPLFLQIVMAIKRRVEENQPIGSGFVVSGSGREALIAAKEIMKQGEIPSQTFPAGTEVSFFFYTYDLGTGFQLEEVRQSKESVSIRYHFPWQDPWRPIEPLSTYCFALIPLGKPTVGNIAVRMIKLPITEKRGEPYRQTYKQLAEKTICKSFTFAMDPAKPGTEINE